jgi:hypothetical protein
VCAETCKHLFGGEGLEFLGNQDPASYPTRPVKPESHRPEVGQEGCIWSRLIASTQVMVVHCARLTGEKGIDACVWCYGDIPLAPIELPPEPAHKEWENDVTGAYVHTTCPA